MVRIISFEGADYTGKTTTLAYLSGKLGKRQELTFNKGLIYPTELTAHMMQTAAASNDKEREVIYAMAFASDAIEARKRGDGDRRTVFQDRYWPSTIAYGRFLNQDGSMHAANDLRSSFIMPEAVILLRCSQDERLRRSRIRETKSAFDKLLLENENGCERLEFEIERSMAGLQNVYRIDTTDKPVDAVAAEVERYLVTTRLLAE